LQAPQIHLGVSLVERNLGDPVTVRRSLVVIASCFAERYTRFEPHHVVRQNRELSSHHALAGDLAGSVAR
jgi:hypothetical protein